MNNKPTITAMLIILAATSLALCAAPEEGNLALNNSTANDTTFGNAGGNASQNLSTEHDAAVIATDQRDGLMNESGIDASAKNSSIQDDPSENIAFKVGGNDQVRPANDSKVSPSARLSTIQSGHIHRTLSTKQALDTDKMWNTIEGVPHGHVTYYN
jgi:glutamate dehydrogenase/leucine dehydrogenase